MSVSALLIPGLYNRHISVGLQSGDATAPVFSVTPFAGSIQDTSIQVRTTITETSFPSTFYVVVLADAAPAPTAAQIRAGTDSLDAPAHNGSSVFNTNGATVTIVVGGLSASTAYDVYYTARDAFTNDSTPAFFNVTTVAASSAEILQLSSDLSRDIVAQEISTNLV